MNRLVLHELPGEEGEGERRSIPVNYRVDVDRLQCGHQLFLLDVERGEKGLASERAGIVFVLSRPIHFSCQQRGSVDAADADHVSYLLRERRESESNPLRGARAAGLSWRIGREFPFVVRNGTDEVDRQAMKHSTVACEVVDQHNEISISESSAIRTIRLGAPPRGACAPRGARGEASRPASPQQATPLRSRTP